MNEIIAQPQTILPLWTIQVSGFGEQAVDARDLHRFLGVGKDFSNWIKDQIPRGLFTEGVDYISVTKKGDEVINDLSGLRPGLDYTVDYYLTLDMAKHVAMLSGTEKGREARYYFLECERRVRQPTQSMTPAELILAQARQLVALEREQLRQAEAQRQLEVRQDSTERRLDQIETATDHFTIVGWHRYSQQAGGLPLADAARMGKVATQFCKDHQLEMGSVPDPRFGTVKTYPKWVLDELFLTRQ